MEFLHKSVTVQSDTECFFRNRISCGNREKTDRKEALLSGQGFFYFVEGELDFRNKTLAACGKI